jgi:dienelactone hydrolase
MAPAAAKIAAEAKRLQIPNDANVYPAAGHSFMRKLSNPIIGLVSRLAPVHSAYDPVIAADAKKRLVAFLRTHPLENELQT